MIVSVFEFQELLWCFNRLIDC